MGFLADITSDRIWTLDTSGMSLFKRRIVRFIKLASVTVTKFLENRMGFQCVALSYFVALAIVPLFAFIFAVTNGLGLHDKVDSIVHNILPNNPEMVDTIIEKAQNLLTTAQSSTVGLISALFFLWTILWLFFQVERVFNNVWGFDKVPRKMYKRFSFYLLFLFLTPFLILVFGFGIAFYSNITSIIGLDRTELKFLPKLLGWFIFFVVALFTFSVMYKFIPAAKVRYVYALKSAIVAAAVFTVFQYIYLETQMVINRLNGVYGALAAIPLFLIWANFSWQIIIYGAQLCYGYHHVDKLKDPEWNDV